MKYLKPFFESKFDKFDPVKELEENREKVIDVLSKYNSLYNDQNIDSLYDFMWNTNTLTDEQAEEAEDGLNQDIITTIVDYYISLNNNKTAEKLLSLYYDCNYALGDKNDNRLEVLKDIFAEYLDDKKGTISKSYDKYDDRYIIEINQDNILTTLDFDEIMNRVDQYVKIENMNFSGNRNFIKFEFYEKYPEDEESDFGPA